MKSIRTQQALRGRVQIINVRTGLMMWDFRNTVTLAGRELVTDFLRQVAVDGIQDILAVESPVGTEVHREAAVAVVALTTTETRYTFFLDEATLVSTTLSVLKLMADTATLVLDTGVEYATVAPGLFKGVNQSLLVVWTVSVI